MKLLWFEEPWEDYLYWQQSDPGALEKVNDLLKDISRSPFKGLGKPEPLKRNHRWMVVKTDYRRASAGLSCRGVAGRTSG